MKKKSRTIYKLSKFFMMFVIVCIGVCSFSFESFAATYKSVHSQPDYGNYSGYLNVLVDGYYSSGEDLVTFAWSVYPLTNTGDYNSTSCIISLYDTEIVFTFDSSSTSYYVMLWELAPNGNRVLLTSGNFDDSSPSFTAQYGGKSIRGCNYKGNVSLLYPATGIYQDDIAVEWASGTDEYTQLVNIGNQLNDLNVSLGGKLDQMILDYAQMLIKMDNTNMYLEGIHYWLIYDFMPQLNSYLASQDTYLYNLVQKLDETNNLLRQFLEQTDADKAIVDDFQQKCNEQSEMLAGLNEQNNVNKPDVDVSGSLDATIDYEGIQLYSGVLAAVTNNPIVIRMIMIVLVMALIAFIMFGKR